MLPDWLGWLAGVTAQTIWPLSGAMPVEAAFLALRSAQTLAMDLVQVQLRTLKVVFFGEVLMPLLCGMRGLAAIQSTYY